MAVNDSRSMNQDFHQGIVDNTYIQLCPGRGNVEAPPISRLHWPQYNNVEKFVDPPFFEAHVRRSSMPIERRNGDSDFGDARY
jgi:hypothetical protein